MLHKSLIFEEGTLVLGELFGCSTMLARAPSKTRAMEGGDLVGTRADKGSFSC